MANESAAVVELTPQENQLIRELQAQLELQYYIPNEARIAAASSSPAAASDSNGPKETLPETPSALQDRLIRERRFCDKYCLRRYLRANSWKLNKALKKLVETLKWRHEMRVDFMVPLHLPTILRQVATGKMFTSGVDKSGLPILCMLPARENCQNDHEGNILNLIYGMERVVSRMDPEKGIEKLVFLIDFKGYSMSNAPPFRTSKATLDILQNHYPERLHTSLLDSPPWLFWGFWKLISPFLDKVTTQKIHMVMGNPEARNKLLDLHVDPSERCAAFGGTNPFDIREGRYRREYFAADLARYLEATHPQAQADTQLLESFLFDEHEVRVPLHQLISPCFPTAKTAEEAEFKSLKHYADAALSASDKLLSDAVNGDAVDPLSRAQGHASSLKRESLDTTGSSAEVPAKA